MAQWSREKMTWMLLSGGQVIIARRSWTEERPSAALSLVFVQEYVRVSSAAMLCCVTHFYLLTKSSSHQAAGP